MSLHNYIIAKCRQPIMTHSQYQSIWKKNLPTNISKFIERMHFNYYTKKFIENMRPCPGSKHLILLLVSFLTSTLQIHDSLKLKYNL